MNRGDLIRASNFNIWLDRLNSIRARHGLSPASGVSTVPQGATITAAKMNELINAMRSGISSNWMNVQMRSQYPVNSGDKIYYDVGGNIEYELGRWEGVCPHDSSFNSAHKSSNFSSHFSSNKSGNYSPDNSNDSGAWGSHGSCDWFNETYYGNREDNGVTSRY